ncbi:MAG: DUF2789 domain-containing protein [Proteobacteria bacterium]|nr:DUF2789 domain-containing protein [Pseudomonadota bacterium]
MDFSRHNINTLFQQLGLPATESDIDSFFSRHKLDPETRLTDADFWTEAQAAFLKEALEEDADWTEIVDQLDARLRH